MAHECKVLTAAARFSTRERGHIHGTLPQQVGHIGHGILCQGLVHHHAGAVVRELHLRCAAERLCHALGNLCHPLPDKRPGLVVGVGGADGAPHLGGVRDDIGSSSRRKPPGGQHAKIILGEFPGVDLLQCNVDMGRGRNGVDAVFRHGTMAAFAVHHNVVLLTACHGDAAARHQHLAQRQRHPGQHMEHDPGKSLRPAGIPA